MEAGRGRWGQGTARKAMSSAFEDMDGCTTYSHARFFLKRRSSVSYTELRSTGSGWFKATEKLLCTQTTT